MGKRVGIFDQNCRKNACKTRHSLSQLSPTQTVKQGVLILCDAVVTRQLGSTENDEYSRETRRGPQCEANAQRLLKQQSGNRQKVI